MDCIYQNCKDLLQTQFNKRRRTKTERTWNAARCQDPVGRRTPQDSDVFHLAVFHPKGVLPRLLSRIRRSATAHAVATARRRLRGDGAAMERGLLTRILYPAPQATYTAESFKGEWERWEQWVQRCGGFWRGIIIGVSKRVASRNGHRKRPTTWTFMEKRLCSWCRVGRSVLPRCADRICSES